ncbi:polyketide cyclase [Mycolicibacterium wolinskyi]|uniref:Polyketide cyclase n=1 Tax=Mycolicibacterium wolinskyi TaxID=59750 RepID=A0A132PQP0_9MYCO|nr:nuclear transport factor 2 family protein [Mycolicibacterium wolinskyi]KWX24362.1 polyketide cyclase [Mycolicibacterium wolinskyi]
MPELNDTVTAYLNTWNATDETDRKQLLHQHWSPDATYVDPLAEVSGHDEISGTIAAVHTQFPGFVFSLVGEPDSHHRQVRFQWGLGPRDADPLVIGFDVLTTDGDGRIDTVLGFLDKVPT